MSSYLTRSHTQHNYLRPAPPRRISVAASSRLNTIFERGSRNELYPNERPPSPAVGRLHNAQSSHLGDPPRESDEKAPPTYNPDWVIPEDGAAHPVRRSKKQREGVVARLRNFLSARGGLWRLALILLVVLLVIIGLALGLGLGLTTGKKHHTSASSSNTNNSTAPFPTGSWLFDVVLSNTTSSCTTNPATWTCFPSTTFAQSPTASRFTFNWVVNATSPQASNLTIASTPNPFSLDFAPTVLTLVDANAPSERYTFSLPLPKQVQPTVSLTPDGTRSICYFNQTVVQASLYTGGNHTAVSDPRVPQDWAGTVFVEQRSPSGLGTPDCYSVADGSRVTGGLDAVGGGDCDCVYVSANGTAGGVQGGVMG